MTIELSEDLAFSSAPSAPSLVKLALEVRAVGEAGLFALGYPILQAAERGDGHPVMVMPGFLASDFSTKLLRTFLRSRNYSAYGWGLGRNMGKFSDPENGCSEEIVNALKLIYDKHGEKVSIIGWSLGGIYARELARLHPEMVRNVITLGSPFKGSMTANRAFWLFEKTSGYTLDQVKESLWSQMQLPPPVPSTSFYSKSDGVTAWECCLETDSEFTENIEVSSSHCGMGHHPFVMWAIANRLAQADGEWQKFQKQGLERWMYG